MTRMTNGPDDYELANVRWLHYGEIREGVRLPPFYDIIQDTLRVLLNTPTDHGMGIPFILWGGPGRGKTAFLETLSLRHGIRYVPMILGYREPTDIIGVPVVRQESDGRYVYTYAVNEQLDRLFDEPAILFFDEFVNTQPQVQNAVLRLVNERAIDNRKLHYGVRIVAASNYLNQTNGYMLAANLANRFAHLQWEPPHEEAVQYEVMGCPFKFRMIEDIDMDRWLDIYRELKQVIAPAFVRSVNPTIESGPAGLEPSKLAHYTERSFDRLLRALATAEYFGGLQWDLLPHAIIGDRMGGVFATFYKHRDLPPVETLLDRPTTFLEQLTTDDKRYLAIYAIGHRATQTLDSTGPAAPDRTCSFWRRAWRLAETLFQQGRPDLSVLMTTTLIQAIPDRSSRSWDPSLRDAIRPPRTLLERITIKRTDWT